MIGTPGATASLCQRDSVDQRGDSGDGGEELRAGEV